MTTTTTDEPGPVSDPGAVRGALVPLLFGFFPTQVLHVAATLQIADHLGGGPRTTADLAAATGTDEPSLARVLRALACFDVVDEVDAGTWALGPHGPGLLTEGPVSLRHLVLLFAGDEVWRSWGELGETVRTGEPAWDRITGASSFEHMRRNPEFQAMFNRAMAEGTRNAAPGIAEAGGFDRFRTIVDVGGGDGTLLAAVLRAHPHLRGTVFDLAEGMDTAPQVLAAAGVSDRGTAEAGDFFAAVPGGHDAYLVKSVIHDWDDDRAGRILRNIGAAMGSGATLLVVEPVMPDAPSSSPDVLMMVMSDLNMLVCTGGKERTEGEFRALLAEAGFAVRAITPVSGPTNYSVIEAVDASG
jgi:orsellinic acid C2-O-methyltransferase